jgi:hypothetical protein
MTKDEVLAEALECMEAAIKSGDWKVDGACDPTMTIERIKHALEAKDEPFGFFQYDIRLDAWVQNRINNKGVAFYTIPPQRIPQDVPQIPQEHSSNESAYQRGYLDGMSKRPQPLTDDQITLIIADCASSHQHTDIHLARAIEQAHGILGK